MALQLGGQPGEIARLGQQHHAGQSRGEQRGDVERLWQRRGRGKQEFAKFSSARAKQLRRARLDHPKSLGQVAFHPADDRGLQRCAGPTADFLEMTQLGGPLDQQRTQDQETLAAKNTKTVIPILSDRGGKADDALQKIEADRLGFTGAVSGGVALQAEDDAEIVLLQKMPGQAVIRAEIIIVQHVATQPALAGKIAELVPKVGPLGVGHPGIVVKRVPDHRDDVPR